MKITAFNLKYNTGVLELLEFSRNDHELTIDNFNITDTNGTENNLIIKTNGWDITKVFVDGSATSDDGTLAFPISFARYGSTNDQIVFDRGYPNPVTLQIRITEYEETEYTAFELSKLTHVKSILYGSGSEKLIALANEIGTPPPNRP
jgi:hypothetical protein